MTTPKTKIQKRKLCILLIEDDDDDNKNNNEYDWGCMICYCYDVDVPHAMCQNKHSFCKDCVVRLTEKCPVCQVYWSEEAALNAEAIRVALNAEEEEEEEEEDNRLPYVGDFFNAGMLLSSTHPSEWSEEFRKAILAELNDPNSSSDESGEEDDMSTYEPEEEYLEVVVNSDWKDRLRQRKSCR